MDITYITPEEFDAECKAMYKRVAASRKLNRAKAKMQNGKLNLSLAEKVELLRKLQEQAA